MLKVINLFIIDKIFSKYGQGKLSPKAQMLYINIIMHHFRDLEAKSVNCAAFSMNNNTFPNFNKYKALLSELSEYDIIQVTDTNVIFYNLWSPYIDAKLLDLEKVSFEPKSPLSYQEEMNNAEQFIELTSMKHSLSKTHVVKLIDLFLREQESFKKTYSSYGECVKHFTYWIALNQHKVPKESVKSSKKMLGG